MGFWVFMLVCNLIIPVVMILGGGMLRKYPPKNINSWYGYRTAGSMKNGDTWKFAQEFCGKLWRKWGLGMLLPSAAVMLPFVGASENAVALVSLASMAVQMLVLAATVFRTEKALGQTAEDETQNN